jgi:RHS repeat-associated protein
MNTTRDSISTDAANATVWTIAGTPGAAPSLQKTVAGRLAMTVSSSSVTNLLTYDAMGNQTAATGGRGHQKSAKPKAQPQGGRDFEAVRTRGARSGIPRRSGNRNTVRAAHDGAANLYAANGLNPYTSVSTFVPFMPLCELIPVFDADGNQTLIRASTAVWDPTDPDATRPLLLQTPSGWFTCGFDQVKNVTELFDASGNIAASYEYAPFGATLSAAGPAAALNPFRFSSEVWDAALGLVCYTFRPYNPLDGRFINRDPIEEDGGLNLYGFAGNDPVNRWDLLGQTCCKKCKWTGSLDGNLLVAVVGGWANMTVDLTGRSNESGCEDKLWKIDGYGTEWIPGASLGAGWITGGIKINMEGSCEWPVGENSIGTISWVGAGGNAGVKASASWTSGTIGSLYGQNWFNIGGVNVFVGGGSFMVQFKNIKRLSK